MILLKTQRSKQSKHTLTNNYNRQLPETHANKQTQAYRSSAYTHKHQKNMSTMIARTCSQAKHSHAHKQNKNTHMQSKHTLPTDYAQAHKQSKPRLKSINARLMKHTHVKNTKQHKYTLTNHTNKVPTQRTCPNGS